MKSHHVNFNRRRDFMKIYGREPTQEELRTFTEYIELIKILRNTGG